MVHSSLKMGISEEVSDRLVVGNYILKVNSVHGAVAELATNQDQPTVRARPTPIFILLPPDDYLLDRQESVKEVIASLKSGQSVELYGATGNGKSLFLSYLLHQQQVKSLFSDGIINITLTHPFVEDILHLIWEAFYESDIPYKPTKVQIQQQIQNKYALVSLDDEKLIESEVEELINAADGCTFLLASAKSRTGQKGLSIKVSGLSLHEAIAFLKKQLQSSLTPEELPAAKSLCTMLNGHPVHLQMAVACIVEEGQTMAELVSQLPTPSAGTYLTRYILGLLSESQKMILELLNLMGDAGLESEQIAAITQLPDILRILGGLRRLYVVEKQDSRYRVSKILSGFLPDEWELTEPLERIIAYFIHWTTQHQNQPSLLLAQMDALIQVVEMAVRVNRWQEVLQLVKIMESSLALSRRWGLWQQILQRGLQASQAEQDRMSEAWALHQLGTRALCLAETDIARSYLNKAMQLREALGDTKGVVITRHNLSLLQTTSPHQEHTTTLQASSDTHNLKKNQPNTRNDTAPNSPLSDGSQEQIFEEDITKHLLTRMTIVSENSSSPSFLANDSFWFWVKGLITTGIVASGGLLVWFYWGRFAPAPSTNSNTTTPVHDTSSSTTSQPQPTKTGTPPPVLTPVPVVTVTVSPIPQATSTVEPALTPNFPEPPKPKPSKQKSQPVSPVLPTPTTIIPTPTIEATPIFTPMPDVIYVEPSGEPTPEETSSTPSFTPEPTTTPEQSTSEPETTSKVEETLNPDVILRLVTEDLHKP